MFLFPSWNYCLFILDQTQDDVNHLKLRVAVLEEQNSKLIFTNASLMELVNDLRKAKQELETENRRIKQDSHQERTNGISTIEYFYLLSVNSFFFL